MFVLAETVYLDTGSFPFNCLALLIMPTCLLNWCDCIYTTNQKSQWCSVLKTEPSKLRKIQVNVRYRALNRKMCVPKYELSEAFSLTRMTASTHEHTWITTHAHARTRTHTHTHTRRECINANRWKLYSRDWCGRYLFGVKESKWKSGCLWIPSARLNVNAIEQVVRDGAVMF